MKDLVARINAEIETFKTESESLTEKGVKAAGARARKSSLELEKLFKEFYQILSAYPQVVYLCGHSHYPLFDDLSVI